ncbi:MerR family transcriptional regulator [Thalassotalea maritima]|uniref:MerR family transcriptional regulator n=1 Tax=Thalassotalea maritima TaxID=3242416 RepID=UPI003527E75B
MYRISELASRVGLSRTVLLYYEKLNLIVAKRQDNGYRYYSDRDVQQVRLIQQLQKGGLTLAECKSCLEQKLDQTVLRTRYRELQQEIEQKQSSLALLSSLLGENPSKFWHQKLAEISPDAHLDWLKVQGYDEKEALRVKWLSKDMNEHDKYMHDFMRVFEALDAWGPSCEQDTIRAFNALPITAKHILEIGCGKGNSTITLAKHSDATIIATDNEESALAGLKAKLALNGLSHQVSVQCKSMTELDFDKATFDVIWAEASAYIMGVENALVNWKPLLAEDGVLVFSDLVWLTDAPSNDALVYWKRDYPDIQRVDKRIAQIQTAGYKLVETFTVSERAWKNYYEPLQARLNVVAGKMKNSQAVSDIQNEVDLYRRHLGEFGYQFFVAQKA